MKQNLIDRFRYLWTWELLNALVIFPLILIIIGLNIPIGVSSILAMVLVCIILLIGSAFAFIKYRDLKNETRNIHHYERLFQGLRWIVPLMLLAVGLLIYLQVQDTGRGNLLVTGLLYLFAVLEYINYFHFQLMYDNHADLQYLASNKMLKQGLIVREFGW